MSVKLINFALDSEADSEGEQIIVRGRLHPESLHELECDSYQREILPLAKISELQKAISDGTVPDVELAMRGWRTRETDQGIHLLDHVFIVDGLQRITAAKRLLQSGLSRVFQQQKRKAF